MINNRLLRKYYQDKATALDLNEIYNNNPFPVKPVVTQNDARSGFLMRYFIRPVNDVTLITEIDEKQYSNFKNNPRFVTVKLKWKIVGKKNTKTLSAGATDFGVEDYNRQIVSKADLTFGGLMNYISDYLEYWLKE